MVAQEYTVKLQKALEEVEAKEFSDEAVKAYNQLALAQAKNIVIKNICAEKRQIELNI